jgi:hypothetical protein
MLACCGQAAAAQASPAGAPNRQAALEQVSSRFFPTNPFWRFLKKGKNQEKKEENVVFFHWHRAHLAASGERCI